jgi:hypothetical protein
VGIRAQAVCEPRVSTGASTKCDIEKQLLDKDAEIKKLSFMILDL